MTHARRRSRDSAGQPDGRDGFPCWIGSNASGVRAYAWESVRLVEWIETKDDGTLGHIDINPASQIVFAHADGEERHLGFIALCHDALGFADCVYAGVMAHRTLAKAKGKVPAC